jgi:C-terminal processing protease CtpA/Prc
MRFRLPSSPTIFPLFLFAITAFSLSAQQPKPQPQISSNDLGRAHAMLLQTYTDVKKNYYDPTYHGVDLDATYKQLDARMSASQTINDTFRVIAALLLQLHDSHTFFQPPMRSNHSTLGYEMEMVGDKCFVTHIRPGTDAATKLHVGDQVLALNRFNIKRADFWDERYFFQILSPAPFETLDVLSPAGERRQVTIQALIQRGVKMLDVTDEGSADFWQLVRQDEAMDHLNRERYYESGDVLLWKMPSFEVDVPTMDKLFIKLHKHQTLILDLRDNPGGYVDSLKYMLGHVFDHDVKIADRISRKDKKPILAKTTGSSAFGGKLIVLVNSQSASAAELFARVVQLEKRGQVIGDQSAGAVMEARELPEWFGTDSKIFYGLSVTSANLLMTDGKSLENTGVTPDDKLLPTAAEVADGKDPVMSHALQLSGITLDSVAAGKLFPYEWPDL